MYRVVEVELWVQKIKVIEHMREQSSNLISWKNIYSIETWIHNESSLIIRDHLGVSLHISEQYYKINERCEQPRPSPFQTRHRLQTVQMTSLQDNSHQKPKLTSNGSFLGVLLAAWYINTRLSWVALCARCGQAPLSSYLVVFLFKIYVLPPIFCEGN